LKLIKRKTFYAFPVHEFNLPAGHSCPFARACKVCVDRYTGKFIKTGDVFRCYAANAERFPAVRKSRWENFEDILSGKDIPIPKGATHVRIHGSGDFFSQAYFDKWLEVCAGNQGVKFWAFTKSIPFWVNRLDRIPENLKLQASYGGTRDDLIQKHGLKYAKVFTSKEDAVASGLPIDIDDTYAMDGEQSFALLDNFKYKKGSL
jgi:hypothetical protein